MRKFMALAGLASAALAATSMAQPGSMNDAQIAHIAYTAGVLDVSAARQALQRSHNKAVRAFAQTMVRDHEAVNVQALALVKKLGVTPQANPTSTALTGQAAATRTRLASLNGAAFDRAYVRNEVAYHHKVNAALESTLIPGAHNGELKDLLQTGLALFREHEAHASQLAAQLH